MTGCAAQDDKVGAPKEVPSNEADFLSNATAPPVRSVAQDDSCAAQDDRWFTRG